MRQEWTTSFILNGFKYMQFFFLAYLVLVVFRVVRAALNVNPYKVEKRATGITKLFCFIYSKLEYSMFISIHQSAVITFSLSIFLQFANVNFSPGINGTSFILSIVGAIYFACFLRWIYRMINSDVW